MSSGGDGVGGGPSGAGDDERGGDDRHGPEGVGEHLQVGAADVERRRPPLVQDGEGHQVDGQADAGDHEHGTGVDLRRVPDPPDRLHEHEPGDAR